MIAEIRAEAAESATPAAHRSRWGFHACDRETFLKIREYHRLMLRAFRQYRRWAAWERKTVHRAGPEPAYFAALVEADYDGRPRFRIHGRFGPNLYHHALAQYRSARMPKADPAAVVPLDLPAGWEGMTGELRAWFGGESA